MAIGKHKDNKQRSQRCDTVSHRQLRARPETEGSVTAQRAQCVRSFWASLSASVSSGRLALPSLLRLVPSLSPRIPQNGEPLMCDALKYESLLMVCKITSAITI